MPRVQDWIKPGMLFFSYKDYWVFKAVRVLQDATDGSIFLSDGAKTYSLADCSHFSMRHFAIPRDFINDGQIFTVWWDRQDRCLYVASDPDTPESAITSAIEILKPNSTIDVKAWEGGDGGGHE